MGASHSAPTLDSPITHIDDTYQLEDISLAIVIPALNEGQNISKTLASVARSSGRKRPRVVVVDGGSTDGTVAQARAAGAEVLSSRRGRGCQLNAGWRFVAYGGERSTAKGNSDQHKTALCSGQTVVAANNRGGRDAGAPLWCLFLHADTLLPERYDAMIAAALRSAGASVDGAGRGEKQKKILGAGNSDAGSGSAGRRSAVPQWGCFESIAPSQLPAWQRWFLQSSVSLRTRLLHMPYGDQALFVESSALEELGGFKEWPLLEDAEIVGRLKALSAPAIVPAALQTSGRRWQQLGFWRTALLNQWVLARWRAGADVSELANVYYGAARGAPKGS